MPIVNENKEVQLGRNIFKRARKPGVQVKEQKRFNFGRPLEELQGFPEDEFTQDRIDEMVTSAEVAMQPRREQ